MPEYRNGNVVAPCPDCGGVLCTSERNEHHNAFGSVIANRDHQFQNRPYSRILFVLMRCASCHRGGLAAIHDNGNPASGVLGEFLPQSIESATLPNGIPKGIVAEFREAEQCISFRAWRASSGLLRSTLEKTLKANGYIKGSLHDKIDQAAKDGVLTESRRKRAHEEVRVLGNDVLHDDWREVIEEEVTAARHYVQRTLEDFYDDRQSVRRFCWQRNAYRRLATRFTELHRYAKGRDGVSRSEPLVVRPTGASKTSRSEFSAAVCQYATPISQRHQALPVDLSDVANQ